MFYWQCFFTWIESISSSHLYNIQVIKALLGLPMNRTEAGYFRLMNHFETEYPTLLWDWNLISKPTNQSNKVLVYCPLKTLEHWSFKVHLLVKTSNYIMCSFYFKGLSDPYCRFRLGNEKYKTKACKETLSPQWKEQFDLKIFPDSPMMLEVTVWDRDIRKDEFMGRWGANVHGVSRHVVVHLLVID